LPAAEKGQESLQQSKEEEATTEETLGRNEGEEREEKRIWTYKAIHGLFSAFLEILEARTEIGISDSSATLVLSLRTSYIRHTRKFFLSCFLLTKF
jgi:hypothetical protein